MTRANPGANGSAAVQWKFAKAALVDYSGAGKARHDRRRLRPNQVYCYLGAGERQGDAATAIGVHGAPRVFNLVGRQADFLRQEGVAGLGTQQPGNGLGAPAPDLGRGNMEARPAKSARRNDAICILGSSLYRIHGGANEGPGHRHQKVSSRLHPDAQRDVDRDLYRPRHVPERGVVVHMNSFSTIKKL